jgi:NAD(P)H-hydrate epimerase
MDRRAIEAGIPGYLLMQRAGEAALASLRRHWPAARSVAVVCGPGNNGGDGYVVARLARAAGLSVRVIAAIEPRALAGDAARAHADFVAAGGRTEPLDEHAFAGCDVVVDALLGTGLSRAPEGALDHAIRLMDRATVPLFALDVPSGLDADSGRVPGFAIRAARTVAFLALKSGYYLARGPDHVGIVDFAGLDVPADIRAREKPVMHRIDRRVAERALPPRQRSAHKGAFGRVVIVGGHAMAGAARLAGEAALRTGAGIVAVVTSCDNAAAILAGRPELIVRGDDGPAALQRNHETPTTVIAIGPGLGTGAAARAAMDAALEIGDWRVIDADALTLLAAAPRESDAWILTPHPGEAARLLGTDTAAIQDDRLGTVRSIAERFGGVCVLKGANTLVCGPDGIAWVCDRGNPGMATAGSGDVLTGVIAALGAAGNGQLDAAAAGVLIHAEAGDRAARAGMRGMIASDIIAELRGVVNSAWT